MAKRILLMYISEISGHHSATLAIESALRALDKNCVIKNVNSLAYANPIGGRVINRLYIWVIKNFPNFWGWMYDNPKVIAFLEPVKHYLHRRISSKIDHLIKNFKPDAVVFTQAYPCGIVAHYKKINNLRLPLVAVLTDYAPHSYWLYDEVDYYIVPSEEARERLIQKGVAEEKIRLLGIPIDLKFLTAGDRGIIFKKFNLNPDLKTVLIMGGGHGLGDIVSITRRLDKEISQNFQMIVVAGINRKVSLKLRKERIKFSKSLLVFDFIQNVNELMDICDIIVTKAGGITTAESLAKGLAMIVTKSIPGQEMNNTKFLADQNISVIANNSDEVIAAVKHLIRDEATLATLRTKAGGLGRPQAALDIARLILEA